MSDEQTAAPMQSARPIVWVRRWRLDGSRIVVALAVMALSIWATVDPPASWEVDVFRAVNDLPRRAEWILWPAQQAGMALAIPAGAVILWFLVRNWRPPATLLAGGILFGWGAAKLIKERVDRGRPGTLLSNVSLGFDVPVGGYGYPSGHAVVVFTLAVVFSPYLPRWLRWTAYGFAVLVCLTRIYMGAHMPLDVIGGAAFGVVIGSLVNLVAGIRADRAGPGALRPG
jgi:membrane-associated phospholipid phosphatase